MICVQLCLVYFCEVFFIFAWRKNVALSCIGGGGVIAPSSCILAQTPDADDGIMTRLEHNA